MTPKSKLSIWVSESSSMRDTDHRLLFLPLKVEKQTQTKAEQANAEPNEGKRRTKTEPKRTKQIQTDPNRSKTEPKQNRNRTKGHDHGTMYRNRTANRTLYRVHALMDVTSLWPPCMSLLKDPTSRALRQTRRPQLQFRRCTVQLSFLLPILVQTPSETSL